MSPLSERVLFAVKLERKTEILIEDAFLTLAGTTRPAMGYHISLVGPAVITDYDAFTLSLARVAKALAEHSPILTTLCSVGLFVNGHTRTPYLSIEKTEPYIALHKRLWAIMQHAIAPENEQFRIWTIDQYMPHVTLGLGLNPGETAEFLRRTKSMGLDISFTVKSVALLRQPPGDTWELDRELILGKAKTGEP